MRNLLRPHYWLCAAGPPWTSGGTSFSGQLAASSRLLAGSQFRGCRFISAAAEARPGDASEVVAAEYRDWLWSLFSELSADAGARHARELGRSLLMLYDGAAVAARMDRDRKAAAGAMRSAVEALLDASLSPA